MKISLKRYLERRMDNMDNATILQAKEYERRLENLNNEAGRLNQMSSTFVRQDTFDTYKEGMISELKT